jgi:hypothetical protein
VDLALTSDDISVKSAMLVFAASVSGPDVVAQWLAAGAAANGVSLLV